MLGLVFLVGILALPCLIFSYWRKGQDNAIPVGRNPPPGGNQVLNQPPKGVEPITPPKDKAPGDLAPKPMEDPKPIEKPDPVREKEAAEKKAKEEMEAKEKADAKKLADGVEQIKTQVGDMNRAANQFKKAVEEGLEPFKSDRYFSRIKVRNLAKKIEDEIKQLSGLPKGKEAITPFEGDLAKAKALLEQFKE